MFEDLKIIHWPDPRLLKRSEPVERFNTDLKALAERMFSLMREFHGVGLAAPQVGQNIRMFVMNPTGNPEDDRVYVNPELVDAEGEAEGEEGCLSLPGINLKVIRSDGLTLRGRDLEGRVIELRDAGYVARIWQHEYDHLDGVLLLDKMGPVAKLANRKTIKEMQTRYEAEHPAAKAGKLVKKRL